MMKFQASGSICALITPMKPDGSIDFSDFSRLIEEQIIANSQGVVVAGTTGEGATLTSDEFIQLLQVARKVVNEHSRNRKFLLIAGTGTNCTRTTIEKTKLASQHQADAALIVTPYYNKPPQEGIYEHFREVATACNNLPIILYNVPGRTASDLLPETVTRLAKIPNIVGIKEASSSLKRFSELKQLTSHLDFFIMSGDDGNAIEAILKHKTCCGVISVTANIFPKEVQVACEMALKEDDKAESLDKLLQPLHKDIFIETNPIPIKFVCQAINKIKSAHLRLPLTMLSIEKQKTLINTFGEVEKALKEFVY